MAKISALADLLATHGLNLWLNYIIDNRKSLIRKFLQNEITFQHNVG